MDYIFNIQRFGLLLNREFRINAKFIGIVTGAIVGLLCFILFVAIANVYGDGMSVFNIHTNIYLAILIPGGILLTSISFSDLHNNLKRLNYLLLPSSSFEKFFSMLLITTVGWVLGFTIVYAIVSEIANGIGAYYTGNRLEFESFNPFSEMAWDGIKAYISVQALFLAGAAYFKNYAFFRTLFTLVVFGALLALGGYLIFADLIHGENQPSGPSKEFKDFTEYTLVPIVENFFDWAMAPVFWVIAFFSLKEKEV
ncbi:hypothetical protein [Flexithrix dorotheae]|uniref:hypothetical protein n=1 Tax=Flexithrix dorotheae TaxID=70993 RepID=UPI00039C90F1|nr:hypothetical protein [Flexithrix dorotheae]